MIIGNTAGTIISALKGKVFINSKYNSFDSLPRKCFRCFYTFSVHKLVQIPTQQNQDRDHDNVFEEHFYYLEVHVIDSIQMISMSLQLKLKLIQRMTSIVFHNL